MNIKQYDNRHWALLSPATRVDLRRHYRLLRRNLHLDRLQAHCAVQLSAGACYTERLFGK